VTSMRIFKFILSIWIMVIGVSLPGQLSAAESSLLPTIAKGKGDKCVLPTEYMRRNHMDLLDHQRDETVLDGVRTKQFSLKGCVSCHAVKGTDGKAVTVKDPKHFCASCHNYAAVHIDCFDCHASRPGEKDQFGGLKSKPAGHDVAALKSYLHSGSQTGVLTGQQTSLRGRNK